MTWESHWDCKNQNIRKESKAMKEEMKVNVCYEIEGHPVEFEPENARVDAIKAYAELFRAAKEMEGENHVR